MRDEPLLLDVSDAVEPEDVPVDELVDAAVPVDEPVDAAVPVVLEPKEPLDSF